jgi:hypothetical protein
MRISRLTDALGTMAVASFASLALCGPGFALTCPPATPLINYTFAMVPTLGVESCVPATGRVTITHTPQEEENMHLEVSGLPANTDFDLFVIQVPVTPFGLAWYMGDVLTDNKGEAVADFIGRFQIGTFIVAPGVAPAPKVLGDDATSNPKTAPVQLYHLGLWFDSPADAEKAGCGNKVTPFNSTHNAGVQILNTSNFPDLAGPLCQVHR